ncbi:hypothetical protein [Mycolicibacterium sp. 120270]|uniref:hypothetical protein n=1 Tax=Mycolicibacterium sp. 120270 TaxID=3090600 RepID=UPI0039B0ECFB
MFIANAGDDSVSAIDTGTRTVTATVKVGDQPGKMGVDPTTGLLMCRTVATLRSLWSMPRNRQ